MVCRALALLVLAFGLTAPAFAETARPRANPLLVPASTAAPVPTPKASEAIGPPTLSVVDPSAARIAAAPVRDPSRGAVTNLPMPRYVSLKSGDGNARRGPGLTHRIDWVFTRAGMPLKITAEHEHWRRIEDAEGIGGWVHFALLSGVRTALVAVPRAEFHSRANASAPVLFAAEANVVGRILECAAEWCRLSVEGERGWVPVADLWGVDPGETIE